MGLLTRLQPANKPAQRFSLEGLAQQISYLGHSYPIGLSQSMTGGDVESPNSSFVSMTQNAYKTNGPVFACVLARAMLFSEARFLWQGFDRGRPGALFGTPALELLETPWPGGTTRDVLWRAEQDVSLGGNFYLRLSRGRLWRLRPDWVTIVIGSQMEVDDPVLAIDAEVAGYLWGKPGSGQLTPLLPDEVAHWAPIPDPEANYRGMSWLTPILREVAADQGAVTHKQMFFEKAATPNLVIMPDASVSYDEFKEFKKDFRDEHEGAWNAYRTLFLGGGSTIQQVGLDFKAMDFKGIQGAGETRIAAAANVPPIIAGFSEGLASATYSNYGQARRKFGDTFARPQWGSFAGSIANIILDRPNGPHRLWYDDRDIAFLREDQGDEAKIRQMDAATIEVTIRSGYKPDAAVAFVQTGNPAVLLGQHTGRMSVQLVPPDQGTIDDDDQDDNEDNDQPQLPPASNNCRS